MLNAFTIKEIGWFQIDKNKIKRIISGRVNNKKTVRFKTNSLYYYFNVSEYVYKSLLSSESKGGFFEDNIKFNYKFKRIK